MIVRLYLEMEMGGRKRNCLARSCCCCCCLAEASDCFRAIWPTGVWSGPTKENMKFLSFKVSYKKGSFFFYSVYFSM